MAISPNAPEHGRTGCLMGQCKSRSKKILANGLFEVKAEVFTVYIPQVNKVGFRLQAEVQSIL